MPCVTPTYTPDDPEGAPVFTPDEGVETDFTPDIPSWHMVEEDDSQCIGEGVTVQLATPPTGLTAVNPTVSTLDISWNASAGSTSYEVDRALTAIGPWANVFTGAGTSFTDSPLDNGTEYFYRVRRFSSLGTSAWSAVVSEMTVIVYGLSRTTFGRIAAYSSVVIPNVTTPFNGSEWAAADITVAISSGRLVFTDIGAAGTIYVPNIVIASRARWFLQAITSQLGSGAAHGPMARMNLVDPATDFVIGHVSTGFNGPQGVREFVGGALAAFNSVNVNYGGLLRTSLWTDGADASVYRFIAAATQAIVLTAGETIGRVGLMHSRGSSGSTQCTDFYAMADRYLQVIGMEAGWTVQVLDSSDVVLATGIEVGGSALVDLFGAVFPTPAKLRILDALGVEVVADAPIERVWGGDVWTLTS